MKKAILVCCLFLCALCFTGCEQVVELTENERYLVAEYAAELLLKYDRKDHTKYEPEDYITTADTEATEELTETEATTESPDAPATETTTEAEKPDNPENPPVTEEPVTDVVTATVDKNFDIAAFVGEDKVSVRYSYYMVVDSYPSYDQDGMFIEIQAPQGYKLLVLKFDIENKTNERQDIDLYGKDITYRVIVDDSKSSKQMFTILMDDLYTFQQPIEASSREEAVLLYTVSDAVAESFTNLKLKVEYGTTNAVIQLD